MADTDETIAALASIVRGMFAAFNARDFNSPFFRDHIANILESGTNDGSAFGSFLPNDLPGHKVSERVQLLTTAYPELKFEIRDLSVEFSNERQIGEVFVNMITTGYYPGIGRPGISRMEFRFIDGRWRMVRHSMLPGGGIAPSVAV